MKTKIFEKTVEIESKENWTYDGVEGSKVKELAPDTYKDVQQKVEYYIDNKEQIEEEEKKKKQQAEYEVNLEKHQRFKTETISEFGEKIDGDDVSFFEPKLGMYGYDARSLDIGSVNIEYDSQVGSPDGWSTHKTGKPWVLYANYKRIRYGTLGTAIDAAIKKNAEAAERKKEKIEAQDKANFIKAELQKFAEENGFELKEEYHRSRYGTMDYYYTYSMVKGNVTANILYSELKKKVIIASYTVKKDNISVEELGGN